MSSPLVSSSTTFKGFRAKCVGKNGFSEGFVSFCFSGLQVAALRRNGVLLVSFPRPFCLKKIGIPFLENRQVLFATARLRVVGLCLTFSVLALWKRYLL